MRSKTVLTYWVIILSVTGSLFARSVSDKLPLQPLLVDTELFVDCHQNVTIATVEGQPFRKVGKRRLGFGYSPKLNVWIRVQLENPYNHPVRRILEYADPLTTHLLLYDGQSRKLLYRGGIVDPSPLRSINPAFPLTLEPHTKKTYYLMASSTVTPLNIELKLWQVDAFYRYEMKRQVIFAAFFGAMGILLLYNLFIFLSVRERINLYYFLAFFGIVFHQFIYRGLGSLYLFTPEETVTIVKYAAFIVGIPVFFLALFTRALLKLDQYPGVDRLLRGSLYFFVGATLWCYIYDLNIWRSLLAVGLLVFLFLITIYAFFKGNHQAKFLIVGWFLLVIPAFLMYLSSEGIYDAFRQMPYLPELCILAETLLFSLLLADRMRQLKNETILSQKRLIDYQQEAERRLNARVEEKTVQLQKSLAEKDLLLRELNHRVKNSIQTVVSFLRLQIDEIDDRQMREILISLENRIFSISQLYSLLYTRENASYIHAFDYFTLLVENIQAVLDRMDIEVTIETDCELPSETAVYCGFIVNEAITNAFKHAFGEGEVGKVHISLKKCDDGRYCLRVADNGKGFDTTRKNGTLGLTIIQSLVIYQLHGTYSIDSERDGTVIEIEWKEKNG